MLYIKIFFIPFSASEFKVIQYCCNSCCFMCYKKHSWEGVINLFYYCIDSCVSIELLSILTSWILFYVFEKIAPFMDITRLLKGPTVVVVFLNLKS